LVPSWAKDLKIGARMINARSETAATKPSFRSAFKSRRCLVVGDGFFEWKKTGTNKQPYYITCVDDRPFCMAGLWESWTDKSDVHAKPVETCTILTTAANATMEPLHDRMPVILGPDEQAFWLDTDFQDGEKLQQLLAPCPADWIHARPVSKIVNKPINDVPECIEAIEAV
jgi:putative SOS response-associated peptidase YedK